MNCSDIQSKVSLSVDGIAGAQEQMLVDAHLDVCPVCRQRFDDMREIRTGLRQFSRAQIPLAVSNRVKLAVRDNIRSGPPSSLPSATVEWLQMRVMPYSIGVAASAVVAVTFLTMMFNGSLVSNESSRRSPFPDTRVLLAADQNKLRGDGETGILPSTFAQSRMAVGGISPSINPQGALIALSRSIVRGNMKDEEVVVVADVFANGLASISQVIEPSDNVRVVEDLRQALASDPLNAPFVPASLDHRPDSVRVVLRFDTVDVNSRQPRRNRSSK